MRDPARISILLELVKKVWQSNPDLRFGQLLENMISEPHGGMALHDWNARQYNKMWNMEEEEWTLLFLKEILTNKMTNSVAKINASLSKVGQAVKKHDPEDANNTEYNSAMTWVTSLITKHFNGQDIDEQDLIFHLINLVYFMYK